MKSIKKYSEYITELNHDTYMSAAKLAKKDGQEKRAEKFISHAWFIEKMKDAVKSLLKTVTFDYYLSAVFDPDEEEHIDIGEVVKIRFTAIEYVDLNEFMLIYEVVDPTDDKVNDLLKAISIFFEDKSSVSISDFGSNTKHTNKFANLSSLNKFFKLLSDIYLLQDKNKLNKLTAKLNDTKVSEVENGDFYNDVTDTFGDFKTFRSKINKRKLYDTYI